MQHFRGHLCSPMNHVRHPVSRFTCSAQEFLWNSWDFCPLEGEG